MINKTKKYQKIKLKFTGERMIPEENKGAAFYYEHLLRYLFASQLVKNKIVLDVACGSGYGCYILSKYGKAKRVIGIDISENSLQYAKEKYSLPNIIFKKDDAEILDSIKDKSIDIVVSFELIEHLKNQDKFLTQIKRVIKDKGIFIVSTPNKYTYPPGNPFHTKELYPEEFKILLSTYFKKVKFYHQFFEFSDTIKEEREKFKNKFNLEENFFQTFNKNFTQSPDFQKSQYLLAVCSNKNIPRLKTYSINSKKVDSFDLSEGMFSLGKQFNELHIQINSLKNQLNNLNEINKNLKQEKELLNNKLDKLNNLLTENLNLKNQIDQTRQHIQNLETQLNTIKSAKFFKLWQFYCKMRDKIFK